MQMGISCWHVFFLLQASNMPWSVSTHHHVLMKKPIAVMDGGVQQKARDAQAHTFCV